MQKNAVVGFVFNEDRTKILLVKRRDISIWVLPGGGVEPNESLENAITREIEEETGVVAIINRKIGEYTPINRFTEHTHLYECRVVGGEIGKSRESADVGFFNLNNLPKPFFHLHRQWLNDAQDSGSKPFKKPLVGVTIFDFIKYAFLHPIRTLRFMLSKLGIPLNTP